MLAHKQIAVWRILNEASPADLPVDRATKFESVIDLKIAKTLRLEMPRGRRGN